MLSKYLLVWILLFLSIAVLCTSIETMKFYTSQSKRVSYGVTKIGYITRSGMTSLLCASFCGAVCGMFEYSAVTGECKTYREKSYDSGVVITSHPDWAVSYRLGHATVQQGDWTLVFRAQSGIGVSVWDTWSNTGVHNDNPIPGHFPHACLRLTDYSSCDRHFRSHILDNWTGIKEVRFAITKGDKERAFILFDGIETDHTSWFNQTKILDSSWSPQINAEPSLLQGVYGYKDIYTTRRFYLSGVHKGCASDWLYTMAGESTTDACVTDGKWHVTWGTPPVFFYSPSSGRASYRTDGAYPLAQNADVFSVWVKFSQAN